MLIDQELPISIEAVERLVGGSEGRIPLPAQVLIPEVDLAAYDGLLRRSQEGVPCYQAN